jgi:hypothetical protein
VLVAEIIASPDLVLCPYSAGLGLFFFLGLLWAVSTINPMFSAIKAIGYFIVTGLLFAVGSRAV